jgi:Immunoglobulin-like domain of bacterial spore germination
VVGRRALIFVISSVITLGGCANDTPERPSVTATPRAAEGCASPAGNVPAGVIDPQVIWPPVPYCSSDPREVARSFATKYIGLEDPQVSEFKGEQLAGGAHGDIDIFRRGEDQALPVESTTVVSTVSLRQLDDAHYFYITSARSPAVVLTAPLPRATISSPVTVEGRGRGFEGKVVVEVRAAYATAALSDQAVIAGSMGALEPFGTELTFSAPAGVKTGAIVAKRGSGTADVGGFTALPVRF